MLNSIGLIFPPINMTFLTIFHTVANTAYDILHVNSYSEDKMGIGL